MSVVAVGDDSANKVGVGGKREGAVVEGDGEVQREGGRRGMAWMGGGEGQVLEKNKLGSSFFL